MPINTLRKNSCCVNPFVSRAKRDGAPDVFLGTSALDGVSSWPATDE